MHPIVEHALALLESESAQAQYDYAFDAVADIVTEFGEADLAERLIQEIPSSTGFQQIARLFDFLAWQTEDNGASIVRTAEQWLVEGSDIRKLMVALSLEVYPFPDAHEMSRVLSYLAIIHPQLSDRCEDLMASRKKRGV
ncbi:hypothetical protein PS3A_25710 [Pseudomonas sp. 3A(2025)]